MRTMYPMISQIIPSASSERRSGPPAYFFSSLSDYLLKYTNRNRSYLLSAKNLSTFPRGEVLSSRDQPLKYVKRSENKQVFSRFCPDLQQQIQQPPSRGACLDRSPF